jgi:acyl-coenzyme A thioesterase PaaI-like protein
MMMIERVNNGFEGRGDGYHCFGCSSNNRKGLKLMFFRHYQTVFARWEPDPDLQGYFDTLHGGIQATMLDEASAWWVYLIAGTAGFTSRLSIRYHRNAKIADSPLFVRAIAKERRRNLVMLEATLFSAEGERYASGDVQFFTYPLKDALENMRYPGLDAFKGEMVDPKDYSFPTLLLDALA